MNVGLTQNSRAAERKVGMDRRCRNGGGGDERRRNNITCSGMPGIIRTDVMTETELEAKPIQYQTISYHHSLVPIPQLLYSTGVGI